MGRVVDLHHPFLHHALVNDEVVGQALGIGDLELIARAGDPACVPHLAAGLAVEGGGLGDHFHLLPGLCLFAVVVVVDQGQNGAVSL